MTDLSVIIPIFNEEKNIPELYTELHSTLESLGLDYEVIAIDDGSQDKSFNELAKIHKKDQQWQIIQFRRNFGQTAGIAAGFAAASGNIIITIDSDLQNDARDIQKLLDKMHEGYDIVSGWRVDRKEAFLSRRLPSILANRLISYTSGVELHDYGCTLKAYRKEVAKNINLYGELHRFIPALARKVGVRVAEVPVNDRPRKHGKSNYGIWRTLRVILDLLAVTFFLRYFDRPIYLIGGAGSLTSFIGFFTLIGLIIASIIQGFAIGTHPLFALAIILFVFGMQMIFTGLLADVLMRTYHESQQQPTYFIREHLTHNAQTLKDEGYTPSA